MDNLVKDNSNLGDETKEFASMVVRETTTEVKAKPTNQMAPQSSQKRSSRYSTGRNTATPLLAHHEGKRAGSRKNA